MVDRHIATPRTQAGRALLAQAVDANRPELASMIDLIESEADLKARQDVLRVVADNAEVVRRWLALKDEKTRVPA